MQRLLIFLPETAVLLNGNKPKYKPRNYIFLANNSSGRFVFIFLPETVVNLNVNKPTYNSQPSQQTKEGLI